MRKATATALLSIACGAALGACSSEPNRTEDGAGSVAADGNNPPNSAATSPGSPPGSEPSDSSPTPQAPTSAESSSSGHDSPPAVGGPNPDNHAPTGTTSNASSSAATSDDGAAGSPTVIEENDGSALNEGSGGETSTETDAAGVAGSANSSGAAGGGGATATNDAGSEPGTGGAGGTAPEELAACAPTLTPLAAGDSNETLQHGGRARTYVVHVPPGLNVDEPVPLVFDLHGAGGNGRQQQQLSGWAAVSNREGFVVVYPDGVDGYWNVDDTCCGTAGDEMIDDVGLLEAIIEKLSGETCVDAKRIYVSGFSNGGGLAHRMGCDAADVIAAVAPVDTDLRTQPCNAIRPISMLEFRGMADTLEPYEGGVVGPPGGEFTSPGAQGSLALWADINGCTGSTTPFEDYCERYADCAEGVETALCSLPGAGHGSYDNTLNFDIASVAWEMFQRNPMR